MAKLTHEQRCGYYFALKSGVDKRIVARASGLDSSVVTRLADDKFKAYRTVEGAYATLGHDEFGKQFYTDEIKTELVNRERELAKETEPNESSALRSKASKLETCLAICGI